MDKRIVTFGSKVILTWRCTILILLIFSVVRSQDEPIRIDETLVNVPVTVFDRDGKYVGNLPKKAFRVFEDGLEQDISYFRTIEEPFTVLVLLDTSGSMIEHMAGVARATAVFISQLRPDDRIIVATFADDTKIHIVLEPTKKKDFKAVIPLRPKTGDSYTTTFNAVDRGMKYLQSFNGRKAIVLFSDGELFGRGVSAKENLRFAEEQEAIIYTVRFGSYPAYQPGYLRVRSKDELAKYGNSLGISEKELRKLIERVDDYMLGLSKRTGGRGFQIDSVANLEAAFRTVADELGQQYSLGFSPKVVGKDGERRRITVKVDVPNAAVRSRNEVVYKKAKK